MTGTPAVTRPRRARPRRLRARAAVTVVIAAMEAGLAAIVLPVQLDTAHLPAERPDRYVLGLLGGQAAAAAVIALLALITLLAWRHDDSRWPYRAGLGLAWLSVAGVILAGAATGMLLSADILVVVLALINAAVCLLMIYTSRR